MQFWRRDSATHATQGARTAIRSCPSQKEQHRSSSRLRRDRRLRVLFQPNQDNDLPQAFPGEMIPDDVPASAAELRPTAGALAWRDAAFQHAEQPMAVPIASLTFTEEGDVTVA